MLFCLLCMSDVEKLAGCYNMMIVKNNISCINKGGNWSANIKNPMYYTMVEL